jgi:hypothetical protein
MAFLADAGYMSFQRRSRFVALCGKKCPQIKDMQALTPGDYRR